MVCDVQQTYLSPSKVCNFVCLGIFLCNFHCLGVQVICFDKYLSSFLLTCTALLSHCLYKRNFKGYLEILAKTSRISIGYLNILCCARPIYYQCLHFVPLKKTKKPSVFGCFQGVYNWNIRQQRVNYSPRVSLCYNYSFLYEFQKQPSEGILRKGNLKICSKFTGEHPCQSIISIKLFCNFIEITLRHGRCPVNLLHILRTPFLKNSCGQLLLEFLFI